MSHDAHAIQVGHDASPNLDGVFDDAQWQAFRTEDKAAGTAVVMLMLAIFGIGVVLYSIVAITM